MSEQDRTPRSLPDDASSQGRGPTNPATDPACQAELGRIKAQLQEEIAERRRNEEALRQAHRALERRADQLQHLAAELTQAEQRERRRLAQVLHDHLQQLLVGARFHLGILRSHPATPEQSPLLQQVETLLGEALTTSRSLVLELSPPILYEGTFLQVLQWLARWMREKHNLTVRVDAESLAEPQAEQMRVFLFHAIHELLLNVVKHAHTDQAAVQVRLEGTTRIRVSVSDDGAGFIAQRPGGPPSPAGGFGLFSMQQRLELLGGTLQIDSTPRRGTRATLLAPIQLGSGTPIEPATAAMGTHTPSSTSGAAGRTKIRVLLADDHDVVRNGLARLLQMQQDIEVIGQASDGQQAVEQVLHLKPDVVVMDVSMPRLSGMEATRRITADLPDVRVIGLSMHGHEDVAAAMAAAGAVAYLAKTSAPEALLAAIRAAGRTVEPFA